MVTVSSLVFRMENALVTEVWSAFRAKAAVVFEAAVDRETATSEARAHVASICCCASEVLQGWRAR